MFVTYRNQDLPVLLSFPIPVVTTLPHVEAEVQGATLVGTDLALVAVLLTGVVGSATTLAGVAAPGDEVFGAFNPALLQARGSGLLAGGASDAMEVLLEDLAPLFTTPRASEGGTDSESLSDEASWETYRLGLDVAFDSWLRQRLPPRKPARPAGDDLLKQFKDQPLPAPPRTDQEEETATDGESPQEMPRTPETLATDTHAR